MAGPGTELKKRLRPETAEKRERGSEISRRVRSRAHCRRCDMGRLFTPLTHFGLKVGGAFWQE